MKNKQDEDFVNLHRFFWVVGILIFIFGLTTTAYLRGVKIAEYANIKTGDEGYVWLKDLTTYSDFSLISWTLIVLIVIGLLNLLYYPKQKEQNK